MIKFKHIVESGLHKADTYQKKRAIVLSNYIALILTSSLLLIIIIRLTVFHDVDKALIINFTLGTVLFIAAIVFNRLFLTTLSRLYLCFLPITFVWYSFIRGMKLLPSIEPTVYDGLRVFLLAISCIPYLLLDKKHLSFFILGILPTFISIFFFEFILSAAGVGYTQNGISGTVFDYIQMRTVISYLIISACCFAFQSIISNNDDFNQRLLSQLKEKTNEIETQNEELLKSHNSLNEINQHLESLVEVRTLEIQKQNDMLVKFAYTNAHHVRRPVARVLGLIQLSKMKTNLDYPWFFEKVEQETKEIDLIVKRIATELGQDPVTS